MHQSETPPEGQHVEGGIFTPWDKILERIERQYETILSRLDSKLDVSAFTAFQSSYEQRHERLQKQIEDGLNHAGVHMKGLDKGLADYEANAARYIPVIEKSVGRIESLEDERLSRDAVKNDRRILYFGGGVLSLLVLVNLILSLIQGAASGGITG